MDLRESIKIAELKNNGMLVISRANSSHSVSGVGVTRGTVNDPPWLEGAAHLAEHMVCRRSHTYSDRQVTLMMERLFGGTNDSDIKVFTTWTNTFYGHDDLLRRADMREAFMLMASLVHDAVIEVHNTHRSDGRLYSLNELLVERSAVHNETQRYMDNLERQVTVALHELVYRSNPVRRDGCANLDQLRKLTKMGRLRQWMSEHYAPANMVAIFMGPKQAEALELVARAELDQLKDYRSSAQVDACGDSLPQLSGIVERVVWRPGIHQTHVGLGWPTQSFTSQESPALNVLVRVLKLRVEELLREKNTRFDAGVYHPMATWYATAYHGLMELWFATVGDGNYVTVAEGMVLDMIRHLRDDTGMALAEEVAAIKAHLYSSFEYEQRFNAGGFCERILEHVSNGDRELALLSSYKRRLLAVTPEKIRALAGEYLSTENFARVVIHPEHPVIV